MTESIARPLTHVELILGLDRFERGYLAQLPATRRLAQEISGHTQHIVETLSLLSHTPQQTARFLVPAMPMASLSTESLLSMRAFYELGDALERLEWVTLPIVGMDPAYPGVDVIFSDIAFYLWLHIVGTVVNTGFREATEPDLRRKDEALGWMADIDPGRRLQCRINIIPRARISLEDFVQITTVPPRRLSRAVSKEKI